MLQLVEPKMQRSPACSSAVAGNMWSTLSQLAQWHIQAAQGCFNGLYLKEQFRFQDNKVMFCLIVLKPLKEVLCIYWIQEPNVPVMHT